MTFSHNYLPHGCLLTDFYQFTMAAALFEQGRADCPAVFHLFVRQMPFKGSFTLIAGIGDALDYVANFKFDEEALAYLADLKSREGGLLFSSGFISYLRRLRPHINIYGVKDANVIFPHEPILRVEGPLALCMLLETPLLNIINFQSLIATKAARMKLAAGPKKLVDFGLRRAQGFDGAISATKAAYIGGIEATSNVWAAKHLGLPLSGTLAHSFVMSYLKESQAFEDYAHVFPDDCALLVDTYDTTSGLREAILTLQRLKKRGSRPRGIRLDSGDLLALSLQARAMLDHAGLSDCPIIASGDLDEYEIERLTLHQAPIDIFGVGTRLVTGHGDPSLGGVYKLASVFNEGSWRDTFKISNSPGKETWPGRQTFMRFSKKGSYVFDQVFDPTQGFSLSKAQQGCHDDEKTMVSFLMDQGEIVEPGPSLGRLQEQAAQNLHCLAPALTNGRKLSRYPVVFDDSLKAKRTRG